MANAQPASAPDFDPSVYENAKSRQDSLLAFIPRIEEHDWCSVCVSIVDKLANVTIRLSLFPHNALITNTISEEMDTISSHFVQKTFAAKIVFKDRINIAVNKMKVRVSARDNIGTVGNFLEKLVSDSGRWIVDWALRLLSSEPKMQ